MSSLLAHSRSARAIASHFVFLAALGIAPILSGCAIIGPIYAHVYNRGTLRWGPMLLDGGHVQLLVPQGGTSYPHDIARDRNALYDNALFLRWSGGTTGTIPVSKLMCEYVPPKSSSRKMPAPATGVPWQAKSTVSYSKDAVRDVRERVCWIACADERLAIELRVHTAVRCSPRTGEPVYPDEVKRYAIDDDIFRTILQSIRIRGADGQYYAPVFDPPLPPTRLGVTAPATPGAADPGGK